MFMKNKDVLSQDDNIDEELVNNKNVIAKENMRKAWGDAFDYYLRGITESYIYFHGRATRLEFWGFMLASLIFFYPIYIIGNFVDVPLLGYYFALATFIPTLGVFFRRFHDLNKKAMPYIIVGILCICSAFFIGYYSLILVSLWFVYIVYLLGKPTDLNVTIFGEAGETDEVYGEDNIKIINKFKKMAILLFFIAITLAGVSFNTWSKINAQRVGFESIMVFVADRGRDSGFDGEKVKEVQNQLTAFIKENQHRAISDDEISQKINELFDNISKLEVQNVE